MWRSATSVLSAVLAVLLAGAAQAYVDVGDKAGVGTPYTPKAKAPPGAVVTIMGGARHTGAAPTPGDLYAGSPTRFEDQLVSVVFNEEGRGLAGGFETGGDESQPVMYSYTLKDGWMRIPGFPKGAGFIAAIAWIDDERALAVGGTGDFQDREKPGANCAEDGDPESDPAGEPRAWLLQDGSWIELSNLEDGTEGDEVPDEMRALSAVDFYLPPPEQREEFGLVGGLCQLWHWRDGGFERDADGSFTPPFTGERAADSPAVPPIDPGSPAVPHPDDLTPANDAPPRFLENLVFRVRDVSFARLADTAPPIPVSERRPHAYAATAGCCFSTPGKTEIGRPGMFAYEVSQGSGAASGSWQEVPGRERERWQISLPNATERDDAGRPRAEVPDSFVSATATRAYERQLYGQVAVVSKPPGIISTPAGPGPGNAAEGTLEPSSTVGHRTPVRAGSAADETGDLLRLKTPRATGQTSLRLLGGDGDAAGSDYARNPVGFSGLSVPAPVPFDVPITTFRFEEGLQEERKLQVGGEDLGPPDGVPDWTVGELTSDGRAALYTTVPTTHHPAVREPPTVESCRIVTDPGPLAACTAERTAAYPARAVENYEAPGSAPDEAAGALPARGLYSIPLHTLRGIAVDARREEAWAVGDHGALVRLTFSGSAGRRAQEPQPPNLGEPEVAEPPDTSPWATRRTRAEPDRAGLVPPLSSQPREMSRGLVLDPISGPHLDEREYGSEGLHLDRSSTTKRIQGIIMSRDGSEGWAFGRAQAMDLFRYDGGDWYRCRDLEVNGRDAPGCKGVSELRREGLKVLGAARVPFEADENPTNDDEMEVVAIVSGAPNVIRYRDGAWQVESDQLLEQVDGRVTRNTGVSSAQVGFTAPDHGWVLLRGPEELVHFDAAGWHTCNELGRPDPYCDNGQMTMRAGDVRINTLVAAGRRIYVGGYRVLTSAQQLGDWLPQAPLIVYREKGDENWSPRPRAGEWDPGSEPSGAPAGALTVSAVHGLAIAVQEDGRYEGWAYAEEGLRQATNPMLARLTGDGTWREFDDGGAAGDLTGISSPMAMLPGGGDSSALLTSYEGLLRFSDGRGRWNLLEGSRPPTRPTAIAPDGEGGAWVAATGHIHRLTRRPRVPVFAEVATPSRHLANRSLTAMTVTRRGTLWATTDSDTLYRHDRAVGWDRVRIPGWDPGRVITRPSPINDIALAPDGHGLAVGHQGRIASVTPVAARLDPAAGRPCGAVAVPPCGTSHTLLSVDVAGDGSAIVGGERRSVLWRPPGGDLRAIEPPSVPPEISFVAVAAQNAERVWLVASNGEVWGGVADGGGFNWRLEWGEDIRAIDARGSGEVLAVGMSGVILERSPKSPWKRLPSPSRATLTAVTFEAGEGSGALAGGVGGALLTRTPAGFRVARAGESGAPRAASGPVTGVALSPGETDGEVEAWASVSERAGSNGRASRLLHHGTTRPDRLLSPSGRSPAIPDAPAPREGEVAFAAFGKSDCHRDSNQFSRCAPMSSGDELAERVSSKIVEELAERAEAGGPALAVYTGDVSDAAGHQGNQVVDDGGRETQIIDGVNHGLVTGSALAPEKFRRWGELVADRLTDAGVPVMGAIGARDLPENRACAYDGCVSADEERTPVSGAGRAGENLAWRTAMKLRSAPWGSAPSGPDAKLRLRRVRDRPLSVRHDDRKAGDSPISTGGAATHYAVDAIDSGGRAVARFIFIDSSMQSLAAGDPVQQPIEPDGGQAAWLRSMLCHEGEPSTGGRCSRKKGQAAVVISNTPTYSYGPGAGTHTAADGAALEAIALAGRANAVVSGRIGWNGLYWTSAPGLHEPCPGGAYPEAPPKPGITACATAAPATAASPALLLSQGLDAAGQAQAALDEQIPGPIPFIVSSGAGGTFAREGGTASDGFWHGYTIVRLNPDGDPTETVVEQRPVYDFVGIEAQARLLRPGQRMVLRGFGRGPLGTRIYGNVSHPIVRYDRINGPAVTHRYGLLEADSDRPWLPRQEDSGEPVPLDPSIATVDGQSGEIRVGRGNNPRTFAVAIMSVGEHVATYPLIFEPRRTFTPKAQPATPRTPSVLVQSAQAGITPPASPSTPPQIGSLSPPALPSFPAVQPPPAVPPVGQPQPAPPPPAPPPPPPPAALELAPAPPGLTVAPPASVIPPPAPPINPAPPGGARKEARQRQAATEKSGSGSGSDAARENDVDLAESDHGPPGSHMTRRDRVKASPSFTAVTNSDQPSAWARGALYGGGLLLASLAASGFWTARPRPRPRPPAVPAPARNEIRRRPWK